MNNKVRDMAHSQHRVLGWLMAILLMVGIGSTHVSQAGQYPVFTDIVEDNADSVVNISAFQQKRNRTTGLERHGNPNLPPGFPEELLRHFFNMIPQSNDDGVEEEASSTGSGFVISSDGYLLTNNHVVEGAEKIVVRFNDRSEKVAQVIGTDKTTDIAVLKVDTDQRLKTVDIGNSDRLKVGEWVMAMGSPFGFEQSVTAGIVSAKRRALPNENYVPFIQTDVAVNPGNSGGPLFNMDGEVVGINAQIYSKSGGFMGLSFAIPINLAMNIAEQIKQGGTIERGYLGIQMQEVTRELSETFGLSKPSGALIAKVYENSPAEKAGLQAGDVILKYDGHEIKTTGDLPPYVGLTPVGKVVNVQIMRRNKMKLMQVTIGVLPDQAVAGSSQPNGEGLQSNEFGATLKALTSEQKQKLGITTGLLVTAITGDVAQLAGLQVGDIILSINYEPVQSLEQFETLLSELPLNRRIPMRVMRDDTAYFIPFVLK